MNSYNAMKVKQAVTIASVTLGFYLTTLFAIGIALSNKHTEVIVQACGVAP